MSEQILHIDSISKLNSMLGFETFHPLVAIIDFSKIPFPLDKILITTDFYSVMVKDDCHASLKYGRNSYDYDEQTMIFVAPRQVIGVENSSVEKNRGVGICFHPDLLKGTALASSIKQYNFFSYEANEALHLSARERRTIGDCIAKISEEVECPIDKHSKRIIASNLELLLDYCQRFYDRQFITRQSLNHDILTKFEYVLNAYFEDGVAKENGLPSVKYCADKLNLSASYMSDVIKRETGKSAVEHIQLMTVERAKMELSTTNNSVSEIAYSLGFEYPSYFSRLFKRLAGISPNEYRNTTYS